MRLQHSQGLPAGGCGCNLRSLLTTWSASFRQGAQLPFTHCLPPFPMRSFRMLFAWRKTPQRLQNMQVVISKSTRGGKKYMAAIEGGTTDEAVTFDVRATSSSRKLDAAGCQVRWVLGTLDTVE